MLAPIRARTRALVCAEMGTRDLTTDVFSDDTRDAIGKLYASPSDLD
jgi:hypothetical protein